MTNSPITQKQLDIIALRIAHAIKANLAATVTAKGRNVSMASLTTSYSLHIALEGIAKELGVEVQWFKRECGVGQPLAYFI